ncbi:hypothetical protein SAMN05216302_10153 [Nitrosomonas aestuarii]|uniref:Phage abortive infection protein n=1 Tax=Nitrosomonas aestuarii TaxID=52441 RepID=A0A1I4C8J8_9PROT|nr:hypothetical protein [Nitrosomonas aestuarii]SFK77484.1 hypothetical protein SAMN05216302_10153 [Nitrosomonas aestuarii]
MNKFFLILFLLAPLTLFASGKANQEETEKNLSTIEIQLLIDEIRESNKGLMQLLKEEISLQNEVISKLDEQAIEIKNLKKKIKENNYITEFIYPIFLSIIAACVFWFFFSFLPEKIRKNKVREKLDLNEYQIYLELFHIFDLLMRHRKNSPSSYQYKILGNKLGKDDIRFGLQNKCLNEHYLYYKDIKNLLLPVGKSLTERIIKIDKNIDRIFNFSFYLSTEEILLLEEIKITLHTYEIETQHKRIPSTDGYYPINPTISYMSGNFYELFALFTKLQHIVFSKKFENRNLFLHKIQHYFYSDNYDNCIKEIRKRMIKYPKEIGFLQWYIFLSEYYRGKYSSAYLQLIQILVSKPNLVGYRTHLKDVLSDTKIQKILNKHYSDDELKVFFSVIESEKIQEENFREQVKNLLDYYKKAHDAYSGPT